MSAALDRDRLAKIAVWKEPDLPADAPYEAFDPPPDEHVIEPANLHGAAWLVFIAIMAFYGLILVTLRLAGLH